MNLSRDAEYQFNIVDHVFLVPGLRGTSTDVVGLVSHVLVHNRSCCWQLQFAGPPKPLRPPSGAGAETNFASQVAIQCSTLRSNVA